jgi:hypothetical protein
MPTAKPTTVTITVPFRNQSVGLFFFGVLQILLGLYWGLFAFFMAWRVAIGETRNWGNDSIGLPTISWAGVVFYLLPTITFIWLGIGSILARRWAWTLTVILSWLWLMLGIGMASVQVTFSPAIQHLIAMDYGKMSAEGATVVFLEHFTATIDWYVFLPLVFLAFYQRVAVRATCFWRDSHIPWTDRCPTPILATSIILASTATWIMWPLAYCCVVALRTRDNYVMWSAFMAAYHFVMSLGGMVDVTVGICLWLLVLAFSMCLALGIYCLKKAAWWGAMLLCVANMSVGAWAFTRLNAFGWCPEFFQRSHGWGGEWRYEFSGPTPADLTCVVVLLGCLMLAWLFCVRRYFTCSNKKETPGDSILLE